MAITAAAPLMGRPRPLKAQNIAASRVPTPPGSGNKKARRMATTRSTRALKPGSISKKTNSNQISNIIPAQPSSARNNARLREDFSEPMSLRRRAPSSSQ